jgi:hypothetical protein
MFLILSTAPILRFFNTRMQKIKNRFHEFWRWSMQIELLTETFSHLSLCCLHVSNLNSMFWSCPIIYEVQLRGCPEHFVYWLLSSFLFTVTSWELNISKSVDIILIFCILQCMIVFCCSHIRSSLNCRAISRWIWVLRKYNGKCWRSLKPLKPRGCVVLYHYYNQAYIFCAWQDVMQIRASFNELSSAGLANCLFSA